MAYLSTNGDTLVCWRFEETAEAPANYADETGTYPVTPTAAAAYIPVITEVGQGRRFTDLGARLQGAGNASAVTALLGEWTLDVIVCPEFACLTTNVIDMTVVTYGANGDGNAVNNVLMKLYLNMGSISYMHENGTGTDVAINSYIPVPIDARAHLVTVRKVLVGGNYDFSFFLDGVFKNKVTGVANATGGGSSGWQIGRNQDTTGSQYPFQGVISGIRVQKVAMTDAAIATTASQVFTSRGNIAHDAPLGQARFNGRIRRSLPVAGGGGVVTRRIRRIGE